MKALRAWVRAVDASDAPTLVRLHRELWIDHDARGGMPASDDDDVWLGYGDLLASQLVGRAGRKRPSEVFDGRTGHLVAEHHGAPVGQVEIALDRFGYADKTPWIAELRSLIVSQRARGLGLGEELVRTAAIESRARVGAATLIVAEVLARNEALRFYERLGFRTLERMVALAVAPRPSGRYRVAAAQPRDAAELSALDQESRARRHALGDIRFDAPAQGLAVDLVRAISDGIQLDLAARGIERGRIREELVVRDVRGVLCGSAYLVAQPLGAPFAAVTRAEVARLSIVARHPNPDEVALAAVAEAFERAQEVGASQLLVRAPYLDPIGALLSSLPGARPFSWILAANARTVAGFLSRDR
ncbi:MAG: GNAT family N-acetyltransferase [Polyangiales bacterium]